MLNNTFRRVTSIELFTLDSLPMIGMSMIGKPTGYYAEYNPISNIIGTMWPKAKANSGHRDLGRTSVITQL